MTNMVTYTSQAAENIAKELGTCRMIIITLEDDLRTAIAEISRLQSELSATVQTNTSLRNTIELQRKFAKVGYTDE